MWSQLLTHTVFYQFIDIKQAPTCKMGSMAVDVSLLWGHRRDLWCCENEADVIVVSLWGLDCVLGVVPQGLLFAASCPDHYK